MLWNAVGGDHARNGPAHTGQPRNEGLHHVGKYVNSTGSAKTVLATMTHHKFLPEGGLQSKVITTPVHMPSGRYGMV